MEIFGLPAHPLIVHAAVVLVPLAALAAAVTCWRSQWRRWFILPVIALAVGGAFFSVLAANSGEDLEERIEEHRIEEHSEAGEAARTFSLLFAATTVGLGAVVFLDDRKKAPSWAPMAAYAVVVLAGVAATVGMVNAGHSGAEAAWKDRVAELTATAPHQA